MLFIYVRGLYYTLSPERWFERVSSCYELDGHCRFVIVDRMCCHRLGVYCSVSGMVVDIRLGKGK
jgi:hypothetical protein